MARRKAGRDIETYAHTDKERVNNPPVGLVTPETDRDAGRRTYTHDPHLDPQLSWAGKAKHTSFEVPTVSLHVHERIDPRTVIEAVRKRNGTQPQMSLFAAPEENPPLRQAIEFYRHRHNWTNRLIAGDSLLVMNSLIEKEGLGGQVQTVYLDPPYGIRYGSNFQPFVNRREVTDGKDEDLTSEPEQIRAFRDTWELGIHSYLITLNMTKVVQHVWEGIRFENTERLEPVFDRDRPIRSTGDMATWYTGKPCGRATHSHINFCVYDGTWEASEAFVLDHADEVVAWVKNDHLGFELFYVHRGVVRKYRPDFLIRLTSGDMLVLEIKGRDSDRDRTKRRFLDEWVRAVNAHGGFGRWTWGVSKSPGDVRDILARHIRAAGNVVAVETPGFGATSRTGFLAGEISVPKNFDRMASTEIETLFETDE